MGFRYIPRVSYHVIEVTNISILIYIFPAKIITGLRNFGGSFIFIIKMIIMIVETITASFVLVQVDLVLVGKAVDCLRILTTGNEANKAALFGIPSALSSLIRLMDSRQPSVRTLPASQSKQDS